MSNTKILRLSALGFVVLLLAASAMFGELMGAFGDPDRVFEDYYAEPANRRLDIAGVYLLTLAGIAFLIFSSRLQALLTGDRYALLHLVSGAAIVFATLLIVAGTALSAVSFSMAYGEAFGDERPFSSGYALMPQLGSVVLVVAAPLVAAFYIGMLAFAGSGHFFPVVRIACFVCAFVLLFGVLYMPLVALPLWVLIVAAWPPREREEAMTRAQP